MNPLIKDRASPRQPAGADKGGWLAVLEQGAHLVQSTPPLAGFDVYVVGFHPVKSQPHVQMEAHHYCRVVNDDLLQCVLFDGNTRQANLVGIEYIVSERLFDSMPPGEQELWHPHNYEILSGSLVAPGLPDILETAFLKRLMNSYGKTWHTWHTGTHGAPGDPLPYGEPMLMWSFNRDGECDPALERDREAAMGIDRAAKRAARESLVPLAHPQRGVDVLQSAFGAGVPIAGVSSRPGRGW
jgi:hypothetical protein